MGRFSWLPSWRWRLLVRLPAGRLGLQMVRFRIRRGWRCSPELRIVVGFSWESCWL